MPYASKTQVPVTQTMAEIGRLLGRLKVESQALGVDRRTGRISIAFEVNDLRFRFTAPLPNRQTLTAAAFAQEERRIWRSLHYVIKAKIESIESGIETIAVALLAHIVMPSGNTLAEEVLPDVRRAYEQAGWQRPALGPGGAR